MGFNPVDLAFGHMNALQSGNERLKAENEKLRVELTDLRLKSCPSCGIKVENEKLRDQLEEQKCFAADLERDVRALRKLVEDMFSYASNQEMELCNACVKADGEFSDCAACDEYDGACGIAKKRFEELYSDRMRELGIGV